MGSSLNGWPETKKVKERGKPPCLWVSRINAVKITILSEASDRFDGKPVKIPTEKER